MLYPSKTPLKKEAFAKINLGLWVLGKREDGYHEIITFMHEITLKDDLLIWEDNDVLISVKGAEINGDNTITKAILEVKKEINSPEGVKILLIKRIPIKAGLGGGSSDAAAAIKAFLNLKGIKLDEEKLLKLASSIGSDVPFFIKGGFCLSFGRGEKIKELNFCLDKDLDIILIIPSFGLETKKVYSWLTPPYSQPPDILKIIEAFKKRKWEFLKNNLKNDLEKPVFERYPMLRSIKEKLLEEGALLAMMSGSGSTIFGIFNRPFDKLESIKRYFGKEFKIILTQFEIRNNEKG
ncbi:MAG: 4-(cytidine 5'-diphospho)-2-C-methyl-D-erythritol kinase [Synergistetes bacterium]|nr:4-(cytidine 5'-diphospho)-2-C-methyl-D-erythritol kinase [Synergistota bacterium]